MQTVTFDDDTQDHGGLTFKSLNAQDWKRIERIPQNMRDVGNMMCMEGRNLVTGIYSTEVLPDVNIDYLLFLREHFKLPVWETEYTIPKKEIKLSKKDIIKQGILRKTWSQDSDKIKEGIKNKQLQKLEHFGGRIEPFTVAFYFWLKTDDISIVDRYTSGEIFLQDCTHPLLSRLIVQAIFPLRLTNGVTYCQAMIVHEEFLVSPSYRSQKGLTLYPEQKKVAESLLQSFRTRQEYIEENREHLPALLIRFCTPPSSGKSSAAGYLGALFHQYQQDELGSFTRRGKRCYIIYSCYSNAVRLDVAKSCVAACVPFAIMTDNIASPSYSCYEGRAPKKPPPPCDHMERIRYSLHILEKCNRIPVILVCDLKSTHDFLQFRHNQKTTDGDVFYTKCIGDTLLLDEPTAFLDDHFIRGENSTVPINHAAILQKSPPTVVLMSATLPQLDYMTVFIGQYTTRYPSLKVINVESDQIRSPCTIVDAKGSIFAPHDIIKASIGEVVKIITSHSHIARCYSPRVLDYMIETFKSEEVLAPLIHNFYSQDIWTFTHCREFCLRILKTLDISKHIYKDFKLYYNIPEISRMCTRDAANFYGSSIIIGEENIGFASEALPPLLVDVPRLSVALKTRETAMNKQRDFDSEHTSSRKTEDSKVKERISSIDRERTVMETDEYSIWPLSACINSKAHSTKYGTRLNPTHYKTIPLLEEDILKFSNPELVEQLLSGVGVLDSPSSDNSFNLNLIDLSEKRSLTYISSGRGIIFGVNLPCDRVIILLNSSTTPLSVLKQAIGRAGRTGKFTKSEIIFADPNNLSILCACPSAIIQDDTLFFDRMMGGSL